MKIRLWHLKTYLQYFKMLHPSDSMGQFVIFHYQIHEYTFHFRINILIFAVNKLGFPNFSRKEDSILGGGTADVWGLTRTYFFRFHFTKASTLFQGFQWKTTCQNKSSFPRGQFDYGRKNDLFFLYKVQVQTKTLIPQYVAGVWVRICLLNELSLNIYACNIEI